MDEKNKMTFLKELVEQARTYGWQTMAVDYDEIREFVKWCFQEQGEKPPTNEELEPYVK